MSSLFTKPLKSLQHLALFALASVAILGAAAPADDFYLVRLQAGKAEAAAGRAYEAIEDLKIATFGFLDQPVLLAEGLSRLALAEAAAGRNDDADATLRRVVEVERRFNAWAAAALEPETRAAVVALAGKKLGPEAAKLLAAPTPATAPIPTSNPTPNPTPTPVPIPEPIPALAAVPAAAAAGPPAPPDSAAVLAESKALVAQGRYVENLRRLVAAVAADSQDRDLRKALLEGASLTKDWGTAAAQLDSLRPFRDGEEPSMFYGAVALYETGRTAEARDLASRALPRLALSPFVDYYARRIQGTVPKR